MAVIDNYYFNFTLSETDTKQLFQTTATAQTTTTSKSAENGNCEAFVVVDYCQFQLMQPQILIKNNKQERLTF